jgi:LPS sulfotransferase NodH
MHHIALSYQEFGDFPRRDAAPALQYMMATSPRSGSTMMALLMWRTGRLGAPMEYLNFPNSGGIVDRLGGGDIRAYWDEVQRRRASPNGVFGYKMFIGNYRNTLSMQPALLDRIHADRVLYLVRRDKVAQAVSHVRAIQSGAWFAGLRRKGEEYDFERILKSYHFAKRQDWQWEKIFRLTGTDPYRVFYEDFLHAQDDTLEAICDAWGIAPDATAAAAMAHIKVTKPQRDLVSHEWRQRFAEELESRPRRRDVAAAKDRLARDEDARAAAA